MVLKNRHRFTPFESPSWSSVVKPESNINRETRQFFTDKVDGSPLHKQKSPKADLKHQQKKVYELTLAGTLALLILTFQLARHFSLTLASAKYNSQKIYIDLGIYADSTLWYEKGNYLPYPYSFPDFKMDLYNKVFLHIRALYKGQRRKLN